MASSNHASDSTGQLSLNQILLGDCIEVMAGLPDKSIDLIFADPPYNLQLQQDLIRPNLTKVDAVNDEWDKFTSLQAYDDFTRAWLGQCRRLLKDSGTIWVIGSYHNIFRVGSILMDLGYWILNDVIWQKTNPLPNFRGTRFTNATETLIWAQKEADQSYTFNYHAMKHMNDEKQMPNVWQIPVCRGSERIKRNGSKAHSTQKPEALLYRVILASSNAGDVVLDPFFGSGTTGAVAKKLKRNFIGIERSPEYVEIAQERLAAIADRPLEEALLVTPSRRSLPRVAFSALIAGGYIHIGQQLYSSDGSVEAVVNADSRINCGELSGSIHKVASDLDGRSAGNGWEYWHIRDETGTLVSIDTLRARYREDHGLV